MRQSHIHRHLVDHSGLLNDLSFEVLKESWLAADECNSNLVYLN